MSIGSSSLLEADPVAPAIIATLFLTQDTRRSAKGKRARQPETCKEMRAARKDRPPLQLAVTPFDRLLSHDGLFRRSLHVSAELIPHGGQKFVCKSCFAAGFESFEQSGTENGNWYRLI